MSTPDDVSGIALSDIAARVGATVEGDGSRRVSRVGTLESAGPEAIAFLANPKYRPQLATTRAGAVIVAPADASATHLPRLVGVNPYAIYARVASLLHPRAAPAPGIHPTAVVADDARVHALATVGAHAVIGARAAVGARAVVGPGCVIGAGAVVDDDATLHANVVVYERCVIGPRSTLHAGAVVGADGFGMAEEDGRWLRIPQVGRVVIGADCEIGANTTIDRGAIDDTVIEDDVKLDNQIQVGHNCRIGRHTAIAGCVGIAGSTQVGRNCRIGGAAMISGHLSIADGTVVGGGTVIGGSIDRPGVYTGVFPSLPYREWQRAAARVRRLDSLAERVSAIERALDNRDER
jgi:UDP-3-O-[3-hydroxymyristoyl] glucosamine N-acyltransferase